MAAGVALASGVVPSRRVLLRLLAAGALGGLLLPVANHYDNLVLLLPPWQMAIIALLIRRS